MDRDVEFTYDWYCEMVEYLGSRYGFGSYVEDIPPGTVLMRHDVDWSPRKALEIAEMEHKKGVESTYFFLVTSSFYNVFSQRIRDKITSISELGHDIGLHFSTHQYWEEEPDKAGVSERVLAEKGALSGFVDNKVDTVSFHNPPEWVFRQKYDSIISTYEPRFFNEIEYVADSNQRWRDTHPFDGETPDKLQILTHPVLWGEEEAGVRERLDEERKYLFNEIDKFIADENDLWEI